MKLLNTPENKAKFFAMYWGQEVYFIRGWNRGKMICDAYKLVREEFKYLKKSYLELIPLSQISDEDAIEACRIAHLTSFLNTKLKWEVTTDTEYGFKSVSSKGSYHSFDIDIEDGSIQMYNGDNKTSNTLNHFGVYKYYISKAYYVGDGTEVEFGWVALKEEESCK